MTAWTMKVITSIIVQCLASTTLSVNTMVVHDLHSPATRPGQEEPQKGHPPLPLVTRPIRRRGSPWRTLRAQGPLPVIRVLTDCGARMRAPYGTSSLVVPVLEKNVSKGSESLILFKINDSDPFDTRRSSPKLLDRDHGLLEDLSTTLVTFPMPPQGLALILQ